MTSSNWRCRLERVNRITFGDSMVFVRLRGFARHARHFGLSVSLLATALPAACARPVVKIPDPIGPNPAAVEVSTGRLVVHTEETPAPYDENQSTVFSPYSVLDSSQQVVLEVDNSSGADVIALAPGRYTVQTDATLGRSVTVPVRIIAGRTTEAHLDGKWKPEGTDRRMLIQGPDGSAIGYRADLTLNTSATP